MGWTKRVWMVAVAVMLGLAMAGGARWTGMLSAAAAGEDDGGGGPMVVARQGYFYVGGREVTDQGKAVIADQMFVEYQIPAKVSAAYPLVMIHGNFQNGSNFLGTPDDREGWGEYFVRRGYPVYVVDQVARGRSAYSAAADGALTTITPDTIERQFTAIEQQKLWPQARLHTQWPGSGMPGDAAFDEFRASQNPSMTDNTLMDAVNRAALVALLRRIGPAVLLTHSRSGSFAWLVADDVPELVKGIVAVEPVGPPFYNISPTVIGDPVLARKWGIASDHLTYEPAVKGLEDLAPKLEDKAQGAELRACWFASAPHRLPRLAGIPVMIVTGEASYHAGYDHCTSQYLTQAGVKNDLVLLGERGVHGNGHMMMLEKNNLQVAGVIAEWVGGHVRK